MQQYKPFWYLNASTCCKYSLGANHLNDKLILFTVNQKHLKSIKRSLKLEQTKPKS